MTLRAEKVVRQFFRQRQDSNVFNAVEETTLTIEPGRITCLSGPSGSGKTTLLSMLAGILRPTSGTVMLGDTDLYALDDKVLSRFRGEHFGVIPQGQTALQSLTVRENILLPYTLFGKIRNGEAVCEHAQKLMCRTGIEDLADVLPSQLSGGELRRMAIARALIRHPEVVLADEPTADLDAANTEIVLQVLREAADEGAAVLIVTHDRTVIEFSDVVYDMYNGKIGCKE